MLFETSREYNIELRKKDTMLLLEVDGKEVAYFSPLGQFIADEEAFFDAGFDLE